jgi:hypothetical protein
MIPQEDDFDEETDEEAAIPNYFSPEEKAELRQ